TETFMSRSPYGMPSWPPRTPDGRLQVAVAVVGARLQAAERLLGGGHDLEDRVSQEGALDGLERPVVADVAEQRDGPEPDRLDRVREGPGQDLARRTAERRVRQRDREAAGHRGGSPPDHGLPGDLTDPHLRVLEGRDEGVEYVVVVDDRERPDGLDPDLHVGVRQGPGEA